MSFIDQELHQTATFWAASGLDGAGEPTWDSPVSINVRWEESAEVFIDDRGEQQVGRSIVFVDRDMSRGDYLFLGTSVAADPHSVSGSRIIKDFRKIPNLGNSYSERRVIL